MGHIKVSLAPLMVLLLLFLLAGNFDLPNTTTQQAVTIIQGHSATLYASSANAVAFQWLKNDNLIIGATQSKYVVSTEGKYQVLTTNAANCTSELSDPVLVSVVPVSMSANMVVKVSTSAPSTNLSEPFTYTLTLQNIGPTTATQVNLQSYLPNEVQFQQLNPPQIGSATYTNIDKKLTWLIDKLPSGQVVVLTFIVKATQAGPIVNTATVTAAQPDPDRTNNTAAATIMATTLNIPNVFTPNGDGVNDVFVIPGLELYTENEFTVINRWGSTVYHKKNYQNDWNGSDLNEGTYYYLLKVHATQWQTYKGYLTLLRSLKK